MDSEKKQDSVQLQSSLYIGSLDQRSNSYRRFEALANLSFKIHGLNTEPYLSIKYIASIQHYYNFGLGIYLLNKKVRKAVSKSKYTIIWVDNKSYLSELTLRYIKKRLPDAIVVNLLTDDPFGVYKGSWKMIGKTAPLYDFFFVQREQNVEELLSIGAQRVGLCYRSFAPHFNRPVKLLAEYEHLRCSTGFIGTYEESRAEFIAFLIESGINVQVTGNGWPEKKYWEVIKPYYRGPSVYGENYNSIINGMDIALHFLRKGNRDVQDSRTFEIPSARVFMLAEYSDVHAHLFKENIEAVFFRTKEELLEKVIYYQSHEAERKAIAENGYQRCFDSGYDHYNTLKKVLAQIAVNEG